MSQKFSEMLGKFTERARKVMSLANQEARSFDHEFVGTEHILLGLVREGDGVAVNVLLNLGVDLARVGHEVEKLIKRGPDAVAPGELPETPRAKKVLDCALDEAHTLRHYYAGTEHLLLGLMRERDGIAACVLTALGLRLKDVRAEVLNLRAGGVESEDKQRS